MTLLRIVSPFFVAGCIVGSTGRVVECAPIVRRWAMGRTAGEVRREAQRRGWVSEWVD